MSPDLKTTAWGRREKTSPTDGRPATTGVPGVVTMRIHKLRKTLQRFLGFRLIPSSMTSASVYLRPDRYLIHPLAGSAGGDPCLFSEPIFRLASDVDVSELGATVMRALDLSRHYAKWPKDWKGFAAPLHKAAGVRSETAFVKGARCLRVDRRKGLITIIPCTSKHVAKGFAPLMDRVITLSSDRPQEVGIAVIEGFSFSD
ncbi:MAG TPA: hypothetical protein VNT30_13135 [Stellaceae bacterium]|nr:hypothetical protein [Stellaceae bacterium]